MTQIVDKFSVHKSIAAHEEKNDMRFLRVIFGFGRYIFVTPYELDGKRHLVKFINVLLLLTLSCYAYLSISSKVLSTSSMSITVAIVDYLKVFMDILFLAICLSISNIFMSQRWKIFYIKLTQVEMSLRRQKFQVKKEMYVFYCEVFSVISIFAMLHSYEIYAWIQDNGNVLYVYDIVAFLGWTVSHIYMNFILLLIYNFTQVLKRRYIFLNDMTKTVCEGQVLDEAVASKVNEIISLYKKCFIVVEHFNKIFGWHMLLYTSVSVVYVLFVIVYSMEMKFHSEKTVPGYLLAADYTISLIVFILSCNSAEASGKVIIQTCYLLHESSHSELVKERLLQLAEYAQHWRPIFSAAGFYNVNQSTLTAIFEAVITYLVILIQFSLALQI
nr:gustatory receptor [Semanotus bifasciatus]